MKEKVRSKLSWIKAFIICFIFLVILIVLPGYLFVSFVLWEIVMPDFQSKEQMVMLRLLLAALVIIAAIMATCALKEE